MPDVAGESGVVGRDECDDCCGETSIVEWAREELAVASWAEFS